MNEVAPKRQLFICSACGKKSQDRFGLQKIDKGWDVSCMLNAVLVYEKQELHEGEMRYVAVVPK